MRKGSAFTLSSRLRDTFPTWGPSKAPGLVEPSSTLAYSMHTNAWIYLSEDEPEVNGRRVSYQNAASSFQQLIDKKVYQAVDTLYICFAETVLLSDQSCGIQLLPPTTPHPDGLTNSDYLKFIRPRPPRPCGAARSPFPPFSYTTPLPLLQSETPGPRIRPRGRC